MLDLREPDEDGPAGAPPTGIARTLLPLDGISDIAFWRTWGGGFNATPLYYPAFLEHFPHRIAEVIGCIAEAPPGGVLFHCSGGRDRTGLIALVLLSLANRSGSSGTSATRQRWSMHSYAATARRSPGAFSRRSTVWMRGRSSGPAA